MSDWKKNTASLSLTFKDDNWVKVVVHYDTNSGYWEFCNLKNEDETYISGGLWFDGIKLTDYDGCYQLPDEVFICLKQLGFMTKDCE